MTICYWFRFIINHEAKTTFCVILSEGHSPMSAKKCHLLILQQMEIYFLKLNNTNTVPRWQSLQRTLPVRKYPPRSHLRFARCCFAVRLHFIPLRMTRAVKKTRFLIKKSPHPPQAVPLLPSGEGFISFRFIVILQSKGYLLCHPERRA